MAENGMLFFEDKFPPTNLHLFKTEDEKSHITFDGITYEVLGTKFRDFLNKTHYLKHAFFPSKEDLDKIIFECDTFARIFSPISPIFYRFGKYENKIYIDLGNKEFEVVEITPDGVRIIKNPPVKFKRSKIQRAIGYPNTKAVPKDLLLFKKYVPFKTDDDFVLFISWLLSCFNTDGGYPPLFLIGEQGSAKSTTTAFIKDLIDLSSVPLRNLSKSMKELMIAATNDFLLCYDNLSKLTDKQSDNLCKLATGAGFTTRKLYTTMEEIQVTAKRPILINGISFVPKRQDLLDRSIIVHLKFIAPDKRKTDKELKKSWEQDRPFILGALCHAVSVGLKNLDQVKVENLPRMADFAKWVIASEDGLPWENGLFLKTMENSRANMVDDAVNEDAVAMAVIKMMKKEEKWSGSPSELLDKLKDTIDQGRNKYPKWPKVPNQLSRNISRVSAFLREKGLLVDKRHSGQRFIEITNLNLTKPEPLQDILNSPQSKDVLQLVKETFSASSAPVDAPSEASEPENKSVIESGSTTSFEKDAAF